MKKIIFISIMIIMIITFSGCGKNESQNEQQSKVHLNVTAGEVKNINDDTSVKIKITKDDDHFKINDEVEVKFQCIQVEYNDNPEANETYYNGDDKIESDSIICKKYKLNENDKICIQYDTNEYHDENGDKSIEVNTIILNK